MGSGGAGGRFPAFSRSSKPRTRLVLRWRRSWAHGGFNGRQQRLWLAALLAGGVPHHPGSHKNAQGWGAAEESDGRMNRSRISSREVARIACR